jgi:hypothetical protein
MRAIVNDPRNVTNRGVLSVFLRSLAQYAKPGLAKVHA